MFRQLQSVLQGCRLRALQGPLLLRDGDRPASWERTTRAVLRLRAAGLSLLLAAAESLGLTGAPATAATLEIREGDTTISRISIRDQTRLRIEGGRVLDVIGDIFDPDKNPAGRVAVLKDDEQGEVYVKPVLPAAMRGADGLPQVPPAGMVLHPVKLDVKTDRGTVGLLLQPADVIGGTLTLRVQGDSLRRQPDVVLPRGAPHIRAVKALTLAMASEELAGEVPMQVLPGGGRELALWKEARFVLRARYEVPGLVGESYSLTNVSAEAMVIDERELYRSGVLAVSLRALQLQPGQSTPVWIVRQAQAID